MEKIKADQQWNWVQKKGSQINLDRGLQPGFPSRPLRLDSSTERINKLSARAMAMSPLPVKAMVGKSAPKVIWLDSHFSKGTQL